MIDKEKSLVTLQELASEVLNIPVKKIGVDVEIPDIGFDSLKLKEFAGKIQEKFDVKVPFAIFFDYSTLNELIDFLEEEMSVA